MQGSGNHGRNNIDPHPTEIGGLVQNTTPQQSMRGFVPPSAAPIKKTPDITDIIGETENGERRTENGENGKQGAESKDEETINHSESVTSVPSVRQKDFSENWKIMFNHVFFSVPTIYIPLKDSLPEIENNIIKVMVKNEIQKEHFEAKIRDVLEFLRTHFNEEVENIIVEANEQMETKKIIYDIKDKLQNFKEQNVEFEDFIQILDLKIKE